MNFPSSWNIRAAALSTPVNNTVEFFITVVFKGSVPFTENVTSWPGKVSTTDGKDTLGAAKVELMYL